MFAQKQTCYTYDEFERRQEVPTSWSIILRFLSPWLFFCTSYARPNGSRTAA